MNSTLRSMLVAAGILAGAATAGLAQEPVTITGRVTTTDGAPVASATVSLPDLGLGATTRQDGRYTILVPAGRISTVQATLAARAINYKPQTVTIALSGTVTQDFALAPNPLQLGEVVVTGAGTTAPVEKLGTVRSSVDSAAILHSAESNIVNALAAKAPGVDVISSSGDPGASSFIQIRGLTTITAADGQPLFVVDGVPVDNGINYNFFGALNSSSAPPNRALDINPDDIENVEVLKGAASGAIYGSRAGQGVILITTKRGRPGATKYSLRSSMSVDSHGQLPELQTKYGLGSGGNPPPCVSGGPLNCAVPFGFAGSWGPLLGAGTPTYDHASEMLQTGYVSDNDLTVSGGNERTTFFLSGGYNRNRGIIVGPNNYYQRIAVRFNGSQQVTDNLKVSANIAYADSRGSAVQSRNSTDGLMLGAWRSPPDFNNLPFLDPVTSLQRSYRFPNPGPGSEQRGRGYDNPFFTANENYGGSLVGRTYGGLTTELNATRWLSFNWTLGYDYSNDERTQGFPWSGSNGTVAGVNGVGGVTGGYIKTVQLDHNLTGTAKYHVSSKWSGTVTLGQNLNTQNLQTRQILGTGLITPTPYNVGNTSSQPVPLDFRQVVHLESYFGQVTADLYDQLYLTVALRNDGASSFGADNRRAWYPKGSAAWTFFKGQNSATAKWLTYGKLRAAYGQSGTQPAPYLLASTFVSGAEAEGGWGPAISTQQNGVGGLFTNFNLPSTQLKPERVKEFETGVDLGLYKDKADLSVTYYRSNSSDVILNLPVPVSTGYSEAPANAAKLRNIGWEVALNLRPITTRNFSWDVGLQWARNKNRVTDLAGVQFVPLPFSGGTNGLGIQGVAVLGEPLGVLYGSDFVRCGRGLVLGSDNIDQTAGECLGAPAGAVYIDASGYPQLDANGTYVIGDPNPDWTGSIHTGLKYHKVSLSALLDVRHGGVAYNGTKGALAHFGTSKESQVLRDGGNYVFGSSYLPGPVAGPGVGTAVPLDESWFEGAGGVFSGPSSEFLEPGGFTKLREVSLGYTFDGPWVSRTLGFQSFEVRIAGRNLHTWTKYTGVDPETSLLGSASAVRGINYFNNPQTRSFVISLTLNR